ncbi:MULTISPECIES: TonB-dependent receptor [unclassified Sphingomonas]|uniref:TonB-dependent receptor n=1 Tax=unclassified Sphingomonas TaxID=196159 RepID=UPI002855BB58|nr:MULTISPECIES: TonB-dependent receptor [unclassified Sphingomonas]MDR6116095.1 iron complex outermembrane receptor protein [Sphingomonas sp. SORGH_AS_0789]MDR6150232.1 iron complex outermembrane receptor protein [Sphingomonas sp. SORGH_AS_0742]
MKRGFPAAMTLVLKRRCLLLAATALMPSSAGAQVVLASHAVPASGPTENAEPEAAPDGSGDVVVTARRREERAQDVPIALSVVGAEQLGLRGDYRLDQVQQLVPSLQVFSFNPRNTNINIRGLGSNVALTNDGLENGVGVYIDNVYYGRVGQSQFDLVDLDRVEVLRGPQGTLFGKNTTAGAINISSRLPQFQWHADGQADIGNYDYRQLRGSVTGPLIDGLAAFRLSAAYTTRDGFLYDTTTRRRIHDYENATVRGQLLLTPAPALTIRIIGDWGQQNQSCCINLPVRTFATYDNGRAIANSFEQRLARFPNYTPLPLDPFARRTDANSPFQANMDTWGVSGQVDYDLGGAALTSITAARQWNWFPRNDGDLTALSINTQGHILNFQRQFSQELRLASTGSHAVDWVLGVYYFQQVVRGYGRTEFGSDAALALFPTDDQTVASIATNGLLSAYRSDPHTKSGAVFGQATWHISPALSLTGGLRYTHEEKWGSYANDRLFAQPTTGLTAAQIARVAAIRNALVPNQAFSVDTDDDSVSGLATLGWKPGEDVLVYATYSRGAKSPGLNLTNLPSGVDPIVRTETVDNFEVGLKSQFLDRRATLNLAAYQTNVTDYQTTIVQQVIGTNTYINYIANIPKVRSRGFEGDLAVRPADWLSLTGSIAYTDATYRDYPNGPTPVEALNPTAANPGGSPARDFTGQRLAGVPKWAASVGGDVTRPIGGGAEAYLHGDWSYRSSYYTVASNSRYGLVPGYGLVNARAGVRLGEDGRYDLSVWARNLFDKDYFQTLNVVNYGLVSAILGDPGTYGATLKVRF